MPLTTTGSPPAPSRTCRARRAPRRARRAAAARTISSCSSPGKSRRASGRSTRFARSRRSARTRCWRSPDGAMLEDETRAEAARLGVRVTWLGFVNQSLMGRVYAGADCLVLPSEFESWGLVVNEAMATGLPAVVSDRGRLRAGPHRRRGNRRSLPGGRRGRSRRRLAARARSGRPRRHGGRVPRADCPSPLRRRHDRTRRRVSVAGRAATFRRRAWSPAAAAWSSCRDSSE